jgi:hypothetical protein
MTERRRPVRTCVGCRTRHTTDGLERYAVAGDGRLVRSRTAPGRGAWACAGSPACFTAACRTGGFARTLRRTLDEAAYDAVRDAFRPPDDNMRDLRVAGVVSDAPQGASKG